MAAFLTILLFSRFIMAMVFLPVSRPSVNGISFWQILLAIGPVMAALFAVVLKALLSAAGLTLPLFLPQKLPSLVCTTMYSSGLGHTGKAFFLTFIISDI